MMYKQGGLAHFQEGGSSSDAAPLVVQQPKKGPLATTMKTIAADPSQTQSILQQMQGLIAERESPMNIFLGGLKDATAWGAGGAEGPTQALAVRGRQREEEAKQLFDMRTQLAGLEAEQARQLAFQKRRAQELGGTFDGTQPTGGGLSMPAGIRMALQNARTEEDYNKIFNTWAQKQAEVSENPEMDVPKIPVVIQNPDGSFERTMISVREYRANPNKYKDTPQTQPAVRAVVESSQPMSVRNNNPGNIKDPKTGEFIKFRTLEEGQKALDDDLRLKLSGQSPAVKQRFGDVNMITPAMLAETWSPATAQGNTPESTINYAKAIANKLGIDPTLPIPNTDQARRLTAQAITEFESGQKAPTQAPATLVASTGPVPIPVAAATVQAARPTPERLERESEIRKAEEIKAGEKRATTSEERRVAFENDTDPSTVTESLVSTRRIQDLVKRDPSLSGVLNAPGVPAAVAKVLEKGVGNFGIADIEQAIYQTLPSTTRKSLGERNELITYLARIELQAAKMIKGQGQITEGEREILARASSSIKDPAEAIYKKAKMLEAIARKNDELGKLYRAADPTATKNFRQFIDKNPEVTKLNEKFRKELSDILNEEVDFSKQRAASGAKKIQHPSDIQAIINKGKKE